MRIAIRSRIVARIPLYPPHPERICWGCSRYCAADELGCAGGTIRTPHPIELFGEDWQEFFGETEALDPLAVSPEGEPPGRDEH